MVGGRAAAAATVLASLFLATMLVVLPTTLLAAAPPSSPTWPNGPRSGWTKHYQQLASRSLLPTRGGLREAGGAWKRSLAGEATEYGGGRVVVPRLLPLASAKRQVPTGADPIHHNERPPSLPHGRRHLP